IKKKRTPHNVIEHRRREKINSKMEELRELLGSPYDRQNKAAVLEATIENIKNLRAICSKLLMHHKHLQQEYLLLLSEQERTFQRSNPVTQLHPRASNTSPPSFPISIENTTSSGINL